MLKIAHISDIHIRNLKFHDEYRAVFENLKKDLLEVRPDLIVQTGDLAHTKTQISPEFVQMTSEFLSMLCSIAPTHMILGNHDLNLMNLDRQDAISPIVDSLKNDNLFLHRKSGQFPVYHDQTLIWLWVYSMNDRENYPKFETIKSCHRPVLNIGLFHGSVKNCVTDSDWVMTSAEEELSIFDGLDFVMMGDIHKRQSFNDGRIAYAGSLIQQNFGEDPKKGYLLWKIDSKDKFETEFRQIKGSRGFYTIRLDEDGDIPEELDIPDDARVRIISQKNLSLIEQKELERTVRNRFKPKDIVSITNPEMTFFSSREKSQLKKEIVNIRSLDVQEKLLRDFFEKSKLSEKTLETIIQLNKKFQVEIEGEEDVVRNVFWRVNKLGWSNLFNYGENNIIDFSKIKGLTGIFAPNTAGKSSIFEVFMEGLFDKVTKDVSKNIELINDNKECASIVIDLSIGENEYEVARSIEKIKYGQRKSEAKEWGKTSLDFSVNDGIEKTSLNGTLRPETERAIRKRVGTFEDFVISTISAQEPIPGIPGGANLISCKETDRKKILCRFLDLDIFEQKCNLAKLEAKKFTDELEKFDLSNAQELLNNYQELVKKLEVEISQKKLEIEQQKIQISSIDKEILELIKSLKPVDKISDEQTVSRKISEQKKKIDILEKELFEKKSERNLLSENIEVLTEKIKSVSTSDDIDDKLLLLTREIGKVESDVEKLKTSISQKKKKLKLLEEVPCGTQYPKCKFLVDAFNSHETVSSDEEEYEQKKLSLNELKKQFDVLKNEKLQSDADKNTIKIIANSKHSLVNLELEIEKKCAKINDLNRELVDLEKELENSQNAKEIFETNKQINVALKNLELTKNTAQKFMEKLQVSSNELHRKYGADTVALKKLTEDIAQFEEIKVNCSAYENYIDAMGKHGIAYKILAEKLPVINDEINKILSNVANFSVFLEHDQNEQTIRLYLQYGDYRSRNLGLSSGAEKFLASLAIRAALLNVSSLPKTNMFIVDEGFGKLDNTHLEAIQKMFHYLKTVFENVVVISHVDILKDMVDNSIEITTDKEGYAHVEVI